MQLALSVQQDTMYVILWPTITVINHINHCTLKRSRATKWGLYLLVRNEWAELNVPLNN